MGKADPKSTASATIGQPLIKVAAQHLTFGHGLYLISLMTVAQGEPGPGLKLPAVRIDALPPDPQNPGRAYVSCLSEGSWLTRDNQGAFLRVDGPQASVIVTTYRSPESGPAPELRIRLVKDAGEGAAAIENRPESTTPAEMSDQDHLPSLPLEIMTHVARLGDIRGQGGCWIGGNLSDAYVEAFSIQLKQGSLDISVEYQAMLGIDWHTPWIEAGSLCGSRGFGLAILGYRVRLTGSHASDYSLDAWGMFNKHKIGPIMQGNLCEYEGNQLTALRVTLNHNVSAQSQKLVVQKRVKNRGNRIK